MERPETKGADWLDSIDVAAPCSANWNEMSGDERSRFCQQCSLHVFDLSAMTRPQAEELVQSRTGTDGKKDRLCIRFTRRADGTVLTQDCPVGLRQRLRRTASRLVAMCAAAFAFLGCRADVSDPGTDGTTTAVSPVPPEPIEPVELQPLQGEIQIMGDIAMPIEETPESKIDEPVKNEPLMGKPTMGAQIMGRVRVDPPKTPEQPEPKKQ